MVEQWYYQNVLYVVVKNILLKNVLKKQQARGLLSNLGIRATLSKIPILRDVLV